MTYPSSSLVPGAGVFPSSSPALVDYAGPGSIWSIGSQWVGYEATTPAPNDLGSLHFVSSGDDSPSVDGWEGNSDPVVDSEKRATSDGTNDGPVQQSGKTVTIKGLVRALDVASLQQEMSRLSGVLAGAVRYDWLQGQEAWMTRRLYVRRGASTIVQPRRTAGRFEAAYSFVLYGPDGRRFADAVSATTGLPSASGGYRFPLRFPFVIASTIVSGRVQLSNPGGAVGPVVLRIDGPVVGPRVTHVGSQLTLAFASSLTLGVGEYLIVDMENQQVLANGQEPRNGSVTQRGWSGFDPGVNEWDFAAVSGSGQLTVTATPAWP